MNCLKDKENTWRTNKCRDVGNMAEVNFMLIGETPEKRTERGLSLNYIGMKSKIENKLENLSKFFSMMGEVDEKTFDNGLKDRIDLINAMANNVPQYRTELMNLCFEMTGKYLDESVIFRHAREKPLGYAGDFRLIDWIYENKTLSEGKGRLLDKAFLRSSSAQSVRNRGYFLTEQVNTVLDSNRRTSILNLGCGPCRDVFAALQILDLNGFECDVHCIDSDHRAVSYAKNILDGRFYGRIGIEWEVANVFHIRLRQKYSLIWASGLFDYLNDRMAVALISRMWRWADNGGRIIVGNFHPCNPERNFMEWCVAWFLIHRSESEMTKLCIEAGIPSECISFEYEPLGINLFLVINKG